MPQMQMPPNFLQLIQSLMGGGGGGGWGSVSSPGSNGMRIASGPARLNTSRIGAGEQSGPAPEIWNHNDWLNGTGGNGVRLGPLPPMAAPGGGLRAPRIGAGEQSGGWLPPMAVPGGGLRAMPMPTPIQGSSGGGPTGPLPTSWGRPEFGGFASGGGLQAMPFGGGPLADSRSRTPSGGGPATPGRPSRPSSNRPSSPSSTSGQAKKRPPKGGGGKKKGY